MAINKEVIGGWIITIILAAFTGLLTASTQIGDMKTTDAVNAEKISQLEKNQDRILKLVSDTHDKVIEIQSNKKQNDEKDQ
jgi:hypothetical protein